MVLAIDQLLIKYTKKKQAFLKIRLNCEVNIIDQRYLIVFSHVILRFRFLASMQTRSLIRRLCPSVRPSVRPSVEQYHKTWL